MGCIDDSVWLQTSEILNANTSANPLKRGIVVYEMLKQLNFAVTPFDGSKNMIGALKCDL